MNTSPLVSVIILTYNQELLVGRAIESILSQIVDFPIEIILADDCSTDDTAFMCEGYAKDYPDIIRLVVNPTNKGLVNNYYDCLLAARGKYIADCAGDDYWVDRYKLAKQVALMEAHPQVQLVHSGWRYLYPDGTLSEPTRHSDTLNVFQPQARGIDAIPEVIAAANKPDPTVVLSTALYRRQTAIDIYNAEPTLLRSPDYPCEDLQLICVLLSRGDIAYIPFIAMHYSCGTPSVSSTEDYAKTFSFYYRALRLRLRLIDRFAVNSKAVDAYLRHISHYLLMQAYHGHLTDERQQILKLMRQHGIRPTLKTRIIRAVTARPTLWRILKG